MGSKFIPGDHEIVIYGAFHHTKTERPRYRLNTSEGRLETEDENAFPNRHVVECFCALNDDGEPLWGNPQNGVEVIVTLNEDGRVVEIRPVEPR